MGRKRGKVKAKLTISVDEELLFELIDDGVNKSKLFTVASKMYLRDKRKIEENKENSKRRD